MGEGRHLTSDLLGWAKGLQGPLDKMLSYHFIIKEKFLHNDWLCIFTSTPVLLRELLLCILVLAHTICPLSLGLQASSR